MANTKKASTKKSSAASAAASVLTNNKPPAKAGKPSAQTAKAAKAAARADGKRVIKKYANRRLYDTELSTYVSLEDIEQMVLKGVDFRVLSQNDDDITEQILVSILLNDKGAGQFIFSERNLRNLITFINGPMLGSVRVFFEQCLPVFSQVQEDMKQKYGASFSSAELENLINLQMNFLPQLLKHYIGNSMDNYLTSQKNMQALMNNMQGMVFPDLFKQMGIQPPPFPPAMPPAFDPNKKSDK